MIKKILKFITILFILIIFSSCQNTPNKSVVGNKNNNFIDILESDSQSAGINEDKYDFTEEVDIFERYEKQWYEDIKVKGKNINVKIESDIVVPNTDKIPVYEIVLDKFSQKQIDGFLNTFGEVEFSLGFELYSKEYYEQKILEMKKYLSVELPNKDCDEQTRQRLKEEYESGIETYTKKMNEAEGKIILSIDPVFTNEYFILLSEQEQTDNEESEFTVREVIERDNTELIDVRWEYKGNSMRLAVQKSDSPVFNSFYYNKKKNDLKPLEIISVGTVRKNYDDLKDLRMTYKRALEIANDTIINNLGIDYLSVSHSATDDKSYIFFFTRNINGINGTYCSNNLSFADIYDEPWPYEYMYVKIDDEGLREISSYSSLTKLGEQISEDAKILPFEEIKNIAKTQIEIGNINFAGTPLTEDLYEKISNMEMLIDEIAFGYQRVKLADNSGKYVMVPVWDFFGSYLVESEYNNGKEYKKSSSDFDYLGTYRHSYLTINAIDGSIIDRSLGY